ncbi:MAG: DUF502 domain-containing protein [Nitrospirota bacterium]|nr:MAG: DUF502 domain-containing protein [Nitrospirota bacterium]
MFRFIGRNILTGLVTILPVALTIYLIYWLIVSTEMVLSSIIKSFLPETLYWPGIGVIIALVAAFTVGLLMRAYIFQQIFNAGEQLLYRMPLIKSVYKAIRDFFRFFSPGAKKEFEQVVAVTIGNTGMKLVGFVTQAIPENMPEGFREEDSILVYLPMSYMIGGYAVLVPRSQVTPLHMNMEDAMRFTLTAGVTGAASPRVTKKH